MYNSKVSYIIELWLCKILREKLIRAFNQFSGMAEKSNRKRKKKKEGEKKVRSSCMCQYFRHFLELSKKLTILMCTCVELLLKCSHKHAAFFGSVNKWLIRWFVWKNLKRIRLKGYYPELSGFLTEKVNESWQLVL